MFQQPPPGTRQIRFYGPKGAVFWLSILMVAFGCGKKESAETEPVVTVHAVRVERAEIDRQVTAEAVVYPIHQAAIVPKISAPVRRFYVSRGDHVRAGQVLAELENKDLAAAVDENAGAYKQAQADFDKVTAANLPEQIQNAEAAVTRAKATYNAAEQLYDNSQSLYQQGALAGKQLNQAEVAWTQARTQLATDEQLLEKLRAAGGKAEVNAAQGQLDAAKGRYEGAQAQYSYSEIRSPIAGVVTERPLFPGELASMTTPLAIVMDLSHVVARAHIPASEAALLRTGDAAGIAAPWNKKTFPAVVAVVSPALDPGNTTVQVWVEAANPREDLKAGAAVRVTITAKRVRDALVIPKPALVSPPGKTPFVMTIGSDSRAHKTDVVTGIQEGDRVQVTQGLKEGQLIIDQEAYGLPDGTKVKY